MPPVIAAATIALVEIGFSFATAIAITSAITTFAVSALVNAGIGLLSSAMARKSTAPSVNRLSDISRYLTQNSIESHKVIYGTAKIAGNLCFRAFSNSGEQKNVGGGFTTDTSENLFQHTVILLAGHECEEIIELYADDQLLTIDSDGYVTNSDYTKDGKYLIRIMKHNGAASQTADAKLVAEYADWTTDHRLRGICYIYARFRMDGFTDSLPTIKSVVKGKKLYDPRTTLTAWSDNWALCVLDYLISDYGFNTDLTEIDTSSFNTAANVSDESVNILPSGTQARYTCNGIVDTAAILVDNLQGLVSGGAGSVVYEQGEFKCYAAAYEAPTVTVTDSWFAGDIELLTRKPRTELFNTVKGVFISPDKDWAGTDFPEVTNSTYQTQDGGEKIFSNIELPFTTDVQRAQRIAKIILEKGRQGITATFNLNLKALQISVWDNIYVTNTTLGWSNKVFRVMSWALNPDSGVTISVQEESSASYNWNSGDATVTDPAPDTNLPSASTVPAPTNLVLTSGNSTLYLRHDGTVMSRLRADWDMNPNPYVQYGGRIEVQFKKSSDIEYEKNGFVGGGEVFDFILDVEDTVEYDVRIRAINSIGYTSEWVYELNHQVVGKTAPPSDVAAISGFQNGGAIVLRWEKVTDVDLGGYEIRYGSVGQAWQDQFILTEEAAGTETTSLAVPPGNYDFCIKAVDTSGNFSTTEICTAIDVQNANDIISQQSGFPLWSGTKLNMIRNPVTGHLNPDDQDLSSGNDFDVFDNFVMNPYSTYSYTSAEIDIGHDAVVRAYSTADYLPGAGEINPIDVSLLFDYHTTSGSYDGFEEQGGGFVNGRYFKFQILMDWDSSKGLAYFRDFVNTVDTQERTESAANVAISIGGTTITFAQQFFQPPSVITTIVGAGAYVSITNLTSSSFKATVYNSSNVDIGGTINWQATGA